VPEPEAMAILDDALARRMALHLGIRVTGTLGVLLRAKAAGHLEAIKPLVSGGLAIATGHGRTVTRPLLRIWARSRSRARRWQPLVSARIAIRQSMGGLGRPRRLPPHR
jgi:hypothetical protein